jgi:hemoglobin-like flavoprotein
MSKFVIDSLQMAADRAGDLTPQVYQRLFARLPETEVLFLRDTDRSIRGSMLSWVFSMILDFSEPQTYGAKMIQNEVLTHEGYGVTPDQFVVFFEVLSETVRDSLGDDWSPDIDAAWNDLLADMTWCARNPYEDSRQISRP